MHISTHFIQPDFFFSNFLLEFINIKCYLEPCKLTLLQKLS